MSVLLFSNITPFRVSVVNVDGTSRFRVIIVAQEI